MNRVLILLLLIGFVFADQDAASNTTTDGLVPFCASWDITTSSDNVDTAFGNTAIASYDVGDGGSSSGTASGYITITDHVQITDFDCNGKFAIRMERGQWTIPADYSDDGNKQSSGTPTSDDSDVQIQIESVGHGYAAEPTEGLVLVSGYDSYTTLTNTATNILTGGTAGTPDEGHGVRNASADINLRILMNWETDIEGQYDITTTLTIVDVD